MWLNWFVVIKSLYRSNRDLARGKANYPSIFLLKSWINKSQAACLSLGRQIEVTLPPLLWAKRPKFMQISSNHWAWTSGRVIEWELRVSFNIGLLYSFNLVLARGISRHQIIPRANNQDGVPAGQTPSGSTVAPLIALQTPSLDHRSKAAIPGALKPN